MQTCAAWASRYLDPDVPFTLRFSRASADAATAGDDVKVSGQGGPACVEALRQAEGGYDPVLEARLVLPGLGAQAADGWVFQGARIAELRWSFSESLLFRDRDEGAVVDAVQALALDVFEAQRPSFGYCSRETDAGELPHKDLAALRGEDGSLFEYSLWPAEAATRLGARWREVVAAWRHGGPFAGGSRSAPTALERTSSTGPLSPEGRLR